MHEYSIVQALIEQCEGYARDNGASAVTRVEVQIGRYSGVETELLERAFETFRESSVCERAQLILHPGDGDEMVLLRLEMEG